MSRHRAVNATLRVRWFILTAIVVSILATVAHARTWKSREGSYSVDAEYVEATDGVVSLRKASGDVIEVQVARLSDDDQAYIAERMKAKAQPAEPPKAPPAEQPVERSASTRRRTFIQLVQSANRLQTASHAHSLFKAFLDDESIAPADRTAAKELLPVWEQRASKHMVRVGTRWVPPEEARDQHLQARQLVDEAMRLNEVGQFDTAIDRCVKASKVDSEDILADFLLGLGYALNRRDAKQANRHFAECVRRDPRHISALNNLALTEVRLLKYEQAFAHWQTALEVAPAAPEVIQNLGRLVLLAKQRRVHLPAALDRRFGNLYAAAAVSAGAAEFSPQTGWLYLGHYDRAEERPKEDKKSTNAEPTADAKLRSVGSATGFVVHPGHVLTNRHVVDGAASLTVVPPGEPHCELPAEVVAVADDPEVDLAILRCEGLTVPPLTFIQSDLAPRGTEVMVLGFPGMEAGQSPVLTSTRGTIARIPSEQFKDYTLDATANRGNSGGPICDNAGNVLGILYAIRCDLPMNYSFGIPHGRALPLVKKCIPAYKPPPPNTEIRAWAQVDDLVSPSTVLIWIKGHVSNMGISAEKVAERTDDSSDNSPDKASDKASDKTPDKTLAPTSAEVLEDRWCMKCYGCGMVECPVRECANGTVRDKRAEEIRVPGGKVTRYVPIRVPCSVCDGKGCVRCPDCDHGIDKGLQP